MHFLALIREPVQPHDRYEDVAKGISMATVTKKELVDRIADLTGTKRVVVKKVVQGFLDEIIEELGRGNRLEFRDFGVFETKERAARTAQNPKTLQRVQVPPKRTVKFKVGRMMKVKLQQGIARDRKLP
ncbi:MAG TPA: HU family DNA-binding protein [Phycisphaerae bacterium]|nr:HU family DNA-binding protein [Phycisphaerae bacterium]